MRARILAEPKSQNSASPVILLWLKSFHIFFVVAWFAGLFYLPRLFVYHADAEDLPSLVRFKTMERRLFILMTIAATMAITFGVAMLVIVPNYLAQGWLQSKLIAIVLLLVYHGWCLKLLRHFITDSNPHTASWYRKFNEVPSVLLLIIVILATVKPF